MTPSKKLLKPPLQVFRGEKVQASYHNEISIYHGNPLIEALPQILTEDEVIEKLEFYPQFYEQERKLPAHQRLHLIQNVLELLILLSPHLDLEQRFSRMIRVGYIGRNPVNQEFWQETSNCVESLRSGDKTSKRRRSTATGFTLLGISGVGKSTAVQAILDLYPQVIYHHRYHNHNYTNTQLVWLKLECPADGSVKGLCLNFFQAVDDILGTSYYSIYGGRGHRTINEMMPYVALVASYVHLGVLVIDEIQSLTKLKVGGYAKMLDFFVQLINTIGIPVVLVGTYKAWSILCSEFRQIRRGTGQGDFIWDRMKEDEDWQLFVEGLWQYQYVQFPCELTPELSHAIYYECQGITDFAVKIFMLAQARAISTGKEKITVAIIKSVARDCLRTAKEVLDALKQGQLQKLHKFEDISPINIEEFILSEVQKLQVNNFSTFVPITESVKVLQKEQSEASTITQQDISHSESAEITSCSGDISAPNKSLTRKRSHKCLQKTDSLPGLPEVVALSNERGISAYEALKTAGYIVCATEYQ